MTSVGHLTQNLKGLPTYFYTHTVLRDDIIRRHFQGKKWTGITKAGWRSAECGVAGRAQYGKYLTTSNVLCMHTHTPAQNYSASLPNEVRLIQRQLHSLEGRTPFIIAKKARLSNLREEQGIHPQSCMYFCWMVMVYLLTPSWGHSLCCPTTDEQQQSSLLDTVWRCHPWLCCGSPLLSACSLNLCWDQEHVAYTIYYTKTPFIKLVWLSSWRSVQKILPGIAHISGHWCR